MIDWDINKSSSVHGEVINAKVSYFFTDIDFGEFLRGSSCEIKGYHDIIFYGHEPGFVFHHQYLTADTEDGHELPEELVSLRNDASIILELLAVLYGNDVYMSNLLASVQVLLVQ